MMKFNFKRPHPSDNAQEPRYVNVEVIDDCSDATSCDCHEELEKVCQDMSHRIEELEQVPAMQERDIDLLKAENAKIARLVGDNAELRTNNREFVERLNEVDAKLERLAKAQVADVHKDKNQVQGSQHLLFSPVGHRMSFPASQASQVSVANSAGGGPWGSVDSLRETNNSLLHELQSLKAENRELKNKAFTQDVQLKATTRDYHHFVASNNRVRQHFANRENSLKEKIRDLESKAAEQSEKEKESMVWAADLEARHKRREAAFTREIENLRKERGLHSEKNYCESGLGSEV